MPVLGQEEYVDDIGVVGKYELVGIDEERVVATATEAEFAKLVGHLVRCEPLRFNEAVVVVGVFDVKVGAAGAHSFSLVTGINWSVSLLLSTSNGHSDSFQTSKYLLHSIKLALAHPIEYPRILAQKVEV